VKVAVYNGNARRNRFDLQVSTGLSVWTTVWSGESSGTTTSEETYDFPDVDARWVRYVGHGSNVGTFNSVTEVSLFAPSSASPTATPTPTSTPTPAGFAYLWLEAESATLTAPMQTAADTAASGGRYLQVAAGNTSTGTPPASGRATFTFQVVDSGTFKAWGRVIAPTTGDDSFWVQMDGAAWVNWNEITLGSAWHWDDVHDAPAGGNPVSWFLSPGVHTLTIAYREDGTKLDRLLLTNDPAMVPSGVGP